MIQIFYSIFNDSNELLFANNTQYETIENAIKDLKQLHTKLLKQRNITITEYTEDTLKFTDNPITELERKEFHNFKILKGVD